MLSPTTGLPAPSATSIPQRAAPFRALHLSIMASRTPSPDAHGCTHSLLQVATPNCQRFLLAVSRSCCSCPSSLPCPSARRRQPAAALRTLLAPPSCHDSKSSNWLLRDLLTLLLDLAPALLEEGEEVYCEEVGEAVFHPEGRKALPWLAGRQSPQRQPQLLRL